MFWLLILLSQSIPCETQYSHWLNDQYDESRKETTYAPPTADELLIVNEIFKRQFGKHDSTTEPLYSKNFIKNTFNQCYTVTDVFRGLTPSLKSGGLFFRAKQNTENFAISIPHSFFDKHTGSLGLTLFRLTRPSYMAINTTHRYTLSREHDLSKHSPSYYLSFFDRLIQDQLITTILELHGFSESKRKTKKARQSDIILSNGSYQPNKKTIQLRKCLTTSEFNVALFPVDTTELGGTKNPLNAIIKPIHNVNFIHMELSSKFRKRLLSNKATINRLAACITSSLGATDG